MKNQYFGDNRDLFTYDLIMRIMQTGLVNHFTFIPMLTEPDGTGHGGKTDRSIARAGTENKELVSFLDEYVAGGERNIEQLASFFAKHNIKMTTYYGEDRYFSHRHRRKYFEQIGRELLSNSLVSVDPDTGLEVKRPTEEHILFDEVRDLYERMDTSSILMIYQYFPRQPRVQYLNMRMEELKKKVAGDYPVCIDDNEIMFFFLTKDESLEHSLTHVIKDYAECYSK